MTSRKAGTMVSPMDDRIEMKFRKNYRVGKSPRFNCFVWADDFGSVSGSPVFRLSKGILYVKLTIKLK